MINLSEKQKNQLKAVAEKYGLKFVIAHGSYATGKEHKGSDLDVAVLSIKEMPFHKQLELHGGLSNIFGDNETRELDLKELNKTDALFRYLVVRDGVLLCGNNADYEELKFLENYRGMSFDEVAKDTLKWRALEWTLAKIIGRAIDINRHIIAELADKNIEPPSKHRETFLILSKLDVLPKIFVEKIADSASLRNRIIHEYDDLG